MQDLKQFARAYFDGLAAKDMSGVPYAEDAILWAPLGPDGLDTPIKGREAILSYFENVFPILGRVEIQNLFSNGEWACGRAFIELTQPAGAKLRVNDVFRISDGRIVEQENHYDPRPALG
jgi:ketosteroid isomerase-like protein